MIHKRYARDTTQKANSPFCPSPERTQHRQFTSDGFVGTLTGAGINASMDGRRRALDNVFIERPCRSVKHEEVYLHDYANVRHAREGIGNYLAFYNHKRIHQGLDYQMP